VNRRGAGQMPPLGSNVVDQKSVELLKEWITSLKNEKQASNHSFKESKPAVNGGE
jgi:hypothetical protein